MDDSQIFNANRGGEFLIKETELSTHFIPEDQDENQHLIRESIKSFVTKHLIPKGDCLDHQIELMHEAAKLGLPGAHVPEQYGGLELDKNTISFILEELGRGGSSFNTTFAAHIGIGMLPILYFGTEDQKQKFLPDLCSVKLMSAYCLTEPHAGSDALSIRTKADLTDDGQFYLISGQKMWISNAGFANIFIVFAKVDGDKFTAFIVSADSEGISLGAEEKKLGIKGSSTRQVFFDKVKVPIENVLGEIGKGHHIAFHTLNIGRFKLGNLTMGGCKKAIDHGVQYAMERNQFGVPISSFGLIQEKIGQMVERTYALESAVYRISNLMMLFKEYKMEKGIPYGQALQQSAEEYAIECALIKVYGSESLDFIVDECLQIHGGNGFSEEFPIATAYRDARINRIYEGTNEINRLLSVKMLIKRVLKGRLNMIDAAWEVQKELKRMPQFSSPLPLLEEAKKAISNFKKSALMVAGAAAKYQMDGNLDLEDSQEIVGRLADILMYLFMAESTVLRYEKLKLQSKEDLSITEAILENILYETQNHLKKLGKDCLLGFAKGDEKKIMLMGLDRFSSFPDVDTINNRRKIATRCYEKKGFGL